MTSPERQLPVIDLLAAAPRELPVPAPGRRAWAVIGPSTARLAFRSATATGRRTSSDDAVTPPRKDRPYWGEAAMRWRMACSTSVISALFVDSLSLASQVIIGTDSSMVNASRTSSMRCCMTPSKVFTATT